MIDMIGEGERERSADKRKLCSEGSLEPSQGLGLLEKSLGMSGESVGAQGWGWGTQRLVGVGGGSSRVTLKNLDFPLHPLREQGSGVVSC